jgi:NADPH:quinone reductase-like Zn-dependent oxidoreductase
VLVRLRAAAVNPADVFFRRLGGYVERPGPFILGHDGAGIVEAVGAEVAGVKTGEFVLIHAGAGGTGHIGVQLARLRGARVATTVSSARKAALAKDLGAELAISYRDQDFVAAAMDWAWAS